MMTTGLNNTINTIAQDLISERNAPERSECNNNLYRTATLSGEHKSITPVFLLDEGRYSVTATGAILDSDGKIFLLPDGSLLATDIQPGEYSVTSTDTGYGDRGIFHREFLRKGVDGQYWPAHILEKGIGGFSLCDFPPNEYRVTAGRIHTSNGTVIGETNYPNGLWIVQAHDKTFLLREAHFPEERYIPEFISMVKPQLVDMIIVKTPKNRVRRLVADLLSKREIKTNSHITDTLYPLFGYLEHYQPKIF